MINAEDMSKYYRIRADNRNLNYANYYSEGKEILSNSKDYTSHNTYRLNIEEIKELLLKIDFIQDSLNA